MTHVLIIRSQEDGRPMVEALKAQGIEVSHHPLFHPFFLPVPLLINPQALIITSKNAIRALEGREDLKHLTLYTVGDKTAELARDMGFVNVLSASGTTQELLQCVVEKADQNRGILYHLSGEIIKGDMVDMLRQIGFQAQRHIVYRIEDAVNLPTDLCAKLKADTISHVIFCSPRTTITFTKFLKESRLENITCPMTALCLSQEVAEKAASLQWKKVWISTQPTIKKLMGYFNEER